MEGPAGVQAEVDPRKSLSWLSRSILSDVPLDLIGEWPVALEGIPGS